MKKVIVLGAGLVGGEMAVDLSKKHKVSSVDISKKNLDKLVFGHTKILITKIFWLLKSFGQKKI